MVNGIKLSVSASIGVSHWRAASISAGQPSLSPLSRRMSVTNTDAAASSYGLDAMQPLFASIPYLRKMGFEFGVDDEQLRLAD